MLHLAAVGGLEKAGRVSDRAVVHQGDDRTDNADQPPDEKERQDSVAYQNKAERCRYGGEDEAEPERADGVGEMAFIDRAEGIPAFEIGDDDAGNACDSGEERRDIEDMDDPGPSLGVLRIGWNAERGMPAGW